MATIDATVWQLRAAMCELLALGFRHPTKELAQVVGSGEWFEAGEEIAQALGMEWLADVEDFEYVGEEDLEDFLHDLRKDATRLFVGLPEPVVSPYEGVWRAGDDGVQPLLFVNPHSLEVESFCRSCGLDRPEGTNEPLDHVATELELLEYLALRAAQDAVEEQREEETRASAASACNAVSQMVGSGVAADAVANAVASVVNNFYQSQGLAQMDGSVDSQTSDEDASVEADAVDEAAGASEAEPAEATGEAQFDADDADDADDALPRIPSKDLPGGSAAAAFDDFLSEHALTWIPRFAQATAKETSLAFYRQASNLLATVMNEWTA